MNLTYDPPPGLARSTATSATTRPMPIDDARPVAESASRSTVKAWLLSSIAARSRTSMTQVSCASGSRNPGLVAEATGANRVWCSHTAVASRAASIAHLGRRASR